MLTYFMNARGKQRKYRFLYHVIRRDILAKKLSPDERLPSKRALAEHLDLSLPTVGNAYAALFDEDYLKVKAQNGFFVFALAIPENGSVTPATTVDPQSAGAIATSAPTTSETESAVPHASLGDLSADFPFMPFSYIARNVLLRFPNEFLVRPENQGVLCFCAATSAYLLRHHGVQAEPAQTVIGSGTEYLYELVAQLLLRAALYGIEVQSYEEICPVYSACTRSYEPLSLDAHGVSADGFAPSRAALPHMTPYQSSPSGATANAAKRFEYLRWTKERTVFLVGDDYAPEFPLQKKPLETTYAMDSNDSMIYLNIFTKTLAPSMRVVYMVLPKRFLESYRERLGFYACAVPALDQYVLAEYINRDYLERRPNQVRRKLRLAKQDSRIPPSEVSPQPPQNGSVN